MSDGNKNSLTLFEYQKPFKLDEIGFSDKEGFKTFLDEVWKKYKEEYQEKQPDNFYQEKTLDEYDEDISKKQPFIYFDGNEIKPRNYIGFLKYKEFSFSLYPKICQNEYKNGTITKDEINQMLLLWLQYSDNVILPKFEAGVSEIQNCDFMDFLIYQFAKYTSDLLSISIYQHYEEISEETPFLKGKLNFNEYIKNCACGKAHKFHCTYDSFEMNNKFNQIIKYTAKSLLNITDNEINTNYLNDIIYTLDEVDDVVCTYSDCEKVYINRFMGDFITVLDYCKLFLKNSVMFNDSGELNNYAFLFRTEVLFEDFISNFAAEKITDLDVKPQSERKLDEGNNFRIRPDLLIENNNKITKIIDIKYKDAKKKGYSREDIYQSVTYAVRLGCYNVTLLYPLFKNEEIEENEQKDLIKIKPEKNGDNDTINLHFKYINCCPCGDNQEELEEKIEKQLKQIIE